MEKYIKSSIIIFLTLFLLFSCKDDDEPRNVQDLRDDFSNLDINAGINDITIESLQEGDFWDMRIIVPESASASNKVPLIISLHGGASIVSQLYKDTECLLEPGFANLDAILISPSSQGYLWMEAVNQHQITAIVDLAKDFLPVDVSRIAITGYSDGGIGSWFFGQHYPDFFSATIPMASMYNSAASSGLVNPMPVPVYVIHGTNDQVFDYTTSSTLIQASIDAGSDITFVTATNLEHYNYCTYAPYLVDAVAWLENSVWN
ncbi:MAG: dienelactone hydrolase family protein [Flavobacteriaceae bacterium]